MKTLAACAAILALLSVDLVGCATASDVDDGIVPRKFDGSNGDGDEEEDADEEDTAAPRDSGTGVDAKADVKSDAASTDARTDAPSSDAASDAKSDASPDTGGPVCAPAGVSECQSADVLPTVSGDDGSDVQTRSGTGNGFVQVLVGETNSAFLGPKDLRVTVRLTSTGGANYDLYVYRGAAKGDGGGVECTTVTAQSNTTGADTAILTWEDNQGIVGFDDDRILSIEVRSATATCSGGWDLTVEGNK